MQLDFANMQHVEVEHTQPKSRSSEGCHKRPTHRASNSEARATVIHYVHYPALPTAGKSSFVENKRKTARNLAAHYHIRSRSLPACATL